MRRERGLSLAEVAVVLALLLVLLAVAVPSYLSYRGRTAVNTAAELTEGIFVRAKEEAKASGFALPETLRASGVSPSAPGGPLGAEGSLSVQLRKRYRAGQPAQLVSSQNLSAAAPVTLETAGFGALDLDTATELEGVYVEFLLTVGGSSSVVATVPVDVNGEMLFHANASSGSIQLSFQDYTRSLTVTTRGVITPDRR